MKKNRIVDSCPVSLREVVELNIIGLTHEAQGVGQVSGYTLFIDGAIPGDVVKAEVTKCNKSYGFAQLVEVVVASKDRVVAPCHVFSACGGCQLQHMAYDAQLQWKQRHVIDQLQRIGKLHEVQAEPYHVHPTMGMSESWRYRNKVQIPIARGVNGEIEMGFYAKRSHQVVDTNTCLIQHEVADQIAAAIREQATKLNVAPYDEQSHTGCLRQVMVRAGYHSGEVMVVLVTNSRHLPEKDSFIKAIRDAAPQVVSIIHNINDRRTNVIFGEQFHLLWGKETIVDSINDIQFEISARSFYQVNPIQTELLYTQAVAYAGLTGKEIVVDAYCGIGTISLFLARHARHVYGMEVVATAIDDARTNAELNRIENVTFEVGLAEEVLPKWREQGVDVDVIVVDPPRKGCDVAFLQTAIAMAPTKIVYVSCNPSTLARDVRMLAEHGYQLVEVQPVDMFPHTTHVECVALIERVSDSFKDSPSDF
jgi:23S rRNA (uracil1939-C5)-methyltransferase